MSKVKQQKGLPKRKYVHGDVPSMEFGKKIKDLDVIELLAFYQIFVREHIDIARKIYMIKYKEEFL